MGDDWAFNEYVVVEALVPSAYSLSSVLGTSTATTFLIDSVFAAANTATTSVAWCANAAEGTILSPVRARLLAQNKSLYSFRFLQ
jgi:hypothetical protein